MEHKDPQLTKKAGVPLSRAYALFASATEPIAEDKAKPMPASPLFEQYAKIAGFSSPLSSKEERDLFLSLNQEGEQGIDAKRKLTSSYMWIVLSAAQEFLDSGVPEEDLLAAGTFTLSYAIGKFDVSKGTRFSTYAYPSIIHALTDTVALASRPIHIPKQKLADAKKVHALLLEEMEKEQRTPTIEELSEKTGFTVSYLGVLFQLPYSALSVDAGKEETGEGGFTALPSTSEEAADHLADKDKETLALALLSSLDDREKAIVRWRNGWDEKPLTFIQIGERLSISPERARQLYVRAEVKMQKAAKEMPNG